MNKAPQKPLTACECGSKDFRLEVLTSMDGTLKDGMLEPYLEHASIEEIQYATCSDCGEELDLEEVDCIY